MNYSAFFRSVYRILWVYLLGLFIFQFFRVFMVINYASWDQLSNYKLDLVKALFYTGFKFDTVVLAYILVIPFALSLAGIFIAEKKAGFHKINSKILFILSVSIYALTIILLTCNYFYYKFFQNNFDLLVFGLFDDDTKAVAYSMWTDYPVIRILLSWLAATILLFFILKKISRKDIAMNIGNNHWRNGGLVLGIIGLFGLGMRGSLGEFPIEKDDATISTNGFINSITMNGVFSLKDAWADYHNYTISADTTSVLSSHGYADKKEALADLSTKIKSGDFFSGLTQTSVFLEKNPPHVVFCLMESMGNYYLDLDSDSLNLLGELKNQLDDCIVFRNFTSGRNSTIHSLEGLMVNTPLTPLSQTSFVKKNMGSSVAKPFLEKGYETHFITGGKLGWRNLGRYAAAQHFNNIEGSAGMMERFPNASAGEWGAYDEFVFQRVHEILKNAKKPQFIFVLLTSNHTPYQLPDSYKPFKIKLTDSIKRVLRCSEDIAIKNFTAYQYASHFLGTFIKNIRSSGLAEKTIITATGDHNTLAVFDFNDANMFMRYSVPFILSIPKEYRPKQIDTDRFGSHKDIFPTIFNLSLSGADYFKSGNDLFGSDDALYFSLNEYKNAFDKNGGVLLNEPPLYYKWSGNTLVTCPENEKTPHPILLKHTKAYRALLELEIKKQLSK
jgi:phosphoglycerol transferase MdoB-like AlkP superfamily enzyme